jgi:hypothetical protein
MKTQEHEKTYLDYKNEHMKKYRNNEDIKKDCVHHIGFGNYLGFLSYQMEGFFQRAGDRIGE